MREELAAIAPPYEAQPPPVARPPSLDNLVPLPLISVPPSIQAPPERDADTIVATVVGVGSETADTFTLRLEPHDPELLAARPGQFVMVHQPGFSPVPISVSRVADGLLWLTIRAAGPATEAVVRLEPGAAGRPSRTSGRGVAA